MSAKRITFLLALWAAVWGGVATAQVSTNVGVTPRILTVDSSSMPVLAGRATLTIGRLHWADGIYSGDYKITVVPYFYKNEKGRLAIHVSDESFAKIARGEAASITGTATTSSHGGVSRSIKATATPADANHGTVQIWFTAGARKMTFQPAYHFAEPGLAGAAVKSTETNRLASLQPEVAASKH